MYLLKVSNVPTSSEDENLKSINHPSIGKLEGTQNEYDTKSGTSLKRKYSGFRSALVASRNKNLKD